MNLVTCWDCNGTGIIAYANQNTAGVDIPCQRCRATGHCDDKQKEWAEKGKKLREWRQSKDIGIMELSNRTGITLLAISEAERGLIDPEPVSKDIHIEHALWEKEHNR